MAPARTPSRPAYTGDIRMFNRMQLQCSLRSLILREMVVAMRDDGHTVADVAARCGRTPQTIRALLSGRVLLDIEDISDLLLAISASELSLKMKVSVRPEAGASGAAGGQATPPEQS